MARLDDLTVDGESKLWGETNVQNLKVRKSAVFVDPDNREWPYMKCRKSLVTIPANGSASVSVRNNSAVYLIAILNSLNYISGLYIGVGTTFTPTPTRALLSNTYISIAVNSSSSFTFTNSSSTTFYAALTEIWGAT